VVNVLGETSIKYSITTHFIERWRQRVNPHSSYDQIHEGIKSIIKYGNRYEIDDNHYRICHAGFCVVFMKLSPLHSLAKTVYEREESTLSAV
jgi:hypothetical protein